MNDPRGVGRDRLRDGCSQSRPQNHAKSLPNQVQNRGNIAVVCVSQKLLGPKIAPRREKNMVTPIRDSGNLGTLGGPLRSKMHAKPRRLTFSMTCRKAQDIQNCFGAFSSRSAETKTSIPYRRGYKNQYFQTLQFEFGFGSFWEGFGTKNGTKITKIRTWKESPARF